MATPSDPEMPRRGDPAAGVSRRIRLLTRPAVLALIGVVVVITGGIIWAVLGAAPDTVAGRAVLGPRADIVVIRAPVAGTVEDLIASSGDRLRPGSEILNIRTADGGIVMVPSPRGGDLVDVRLASGTRVAAGDTIGLLASSLAARVAIAFIPIGRVQGVKRGMKAFVAPDDVPPSQYGMIEGVVSGVSVTPVTLQRVTAVLRGNTELSQYFTSRGPVFEVRVTLATDRSTPSGLKWSVGSGPPTPVAAGSLADARVVLAEQSIARALLP